MHGPVWLLAPSITLLATLLVACGDAGPATPTALVEAAPAATPAPSASVPPSASDLPSLFGGFSQRISASFVDQDRGWIATGNTILHTDDGGLHWIKQYEMAAAVDVDPISPTEGYSSADGELFVTSDGGATRQQSGALPGGPDAHPRFVDMHHGWLLLDQLDQKRREIMRTDGWWRYVAERR